MLALALGSTVGELQQRMGAHEFSEWFAFYQLSPFGDERADFQAGNIAATVVNLFQEKGNTISPADFFYPTPWHRDSDIQTASDDDAAVEAALMSMPGVTRANPVFEPGSKDEDAELIQMFGATKKEKT